MFRDEAYKVKSVKWDGERDVEFILDSVDNDLTGVHWCVPRKDFWHYDRNWEAILVPGVFVTLWSTKGRLVVGLQVLWNDRWTDVWCAANHFRTKAEREVDDKAYVGAIMDAADALIKSMDDGAVPEVALKSLNGRGLSGNQAGEAVFQAVKKSKRGHILKEHWNAKWGVSSDGVVNPAVVEVG